MTTKTGVSKDYMKIAKRRITQPSKQQSYRRFLFYARNKKGKTTMALSGGAERTLVLDPEHGTDTLKTSDPYVWHIEKWEDLNEAYQFLRQGPTSPADLGVGPETEPFKYVVPDGVTRMNNMALRYVMHQAELKDLDRRPGMVDRRDYNKSGELMKQMLLNFHSLPMNVIYTAQERAVSPETTSEDEESSTFYVPDLPQGVRGSINSIVEVIGRLYTARVNVKLQGGGTAERIQRRLWLEVHESYDTGYRSEFVLPEMLKNPTIPKLEALMLSGSQKGGKE